MKTAQLPPQALDAERGVIGSMWMFPELCDELAVVLKAEDFYNPANSILFRRTLEMHNAGKRPDTTLLHAKLEATGELLEVGGVAYMLEVAEATPHAGNAVHYAKLIRDKATLRRLRDACEDTLCEVAAEMEDANFILNQAEQRIFKVREVRGGNDAHHIGDVLMEALDGIERGDPSFRQGLSSGMKNVDTLTGGFRPAEVTILAGRPGNGKSALAGNIAEHLSLKCDKWVLFVSLEMSKLELGERLLSAHGGINSYKLKSGTLSDADRRKLLEAYGKLAKAKLTIDDCPSRTMTEIAALCRRMKRAKKLDLLVIDYLQLVTPENKKDPRQEQVASMSRRLKHMTKELNVPILCLAQLNRQAETTGEPQLWHLRESGAIEQDADKVMFIWRCGEQGTDAVLKVAKNRNGTTGKVNLTFNAEHVRFYERADVGVERAREQFEHDYGNLSEDF